MLRRRGCLLATPTSAVFRNCFPTLLWPAVGNFFRSSSSPPTGTSEKDKCNSWGPLGRPMANPLPLLCLRKPPCGPLCFLKPSTRLPSVCPAPITQAEVHSNPAALMGLIQLMLLPTPRRSEHHPLAQPRGRALIPATIQENLQRCHTQFLLPLKEHTKEHPWVTGSGATSQRVRPGGQE